MFPYTAFSLGFEHSVDVIKEFATHVGKTATYYSFGIFGGSLFREYDVGQHEGRKVALLLSASPNISEIHMWRDYCLTAEDLALVPFFPRLKVNTYCT